MSIEQDFNDFHQRNPHVYKTLLIKARQYRNFNPTGRLGIRTLWENMRWDYLLSTEHQEFKLNDHFTSHYARMLMAKNPEMLGMFELRSLRAA